LRKPTIAKGRCRKKFRIPNLELGFLGGLSHYSIESQLRERGGMVYTSILPHYSDSEGSDQLETLTLYGVENAACGSVESGLFGCGGGHILVRHTGIGAGRWRNCHRACKHTESSNQYARGSPKVTEPNDTKHDQSCARTISRGVTWWRRRSRNGRSSF